MSEHDDPTLRWTAWFERGFQWSLARYERSLDWCLARLAYYKAPGYVAFVDALPLTASQKVQRGELRALAVALVGQANCIDTGAMKKRAS